MKKSSPLLAAIAFSLAAAINFYIGLANPAYTYRICLVAGFLFCAATLLEMREWNKRRGK